MMKSCTYHGRKRKLYIYNIHVSYMVINVCYSKGNSDKVTHSFSQFALSTWTWYCFPHFFQTVSVGRRKFSADFQLVFRLIKGLIFLTFVSILVTLIALPHMTVQDIIVCILAFMPTGWGMLLVSSVEHWLSLPPNFIFEALVLSFIIWSLYFNFIVNWLL